VIQRQGEQTARDRRELLSERIRAAFLAGAEEYSWRRLGRGLTRDELERVQRRYPGNF
jgi:DNA invertase Pin-like site-specific DNA recombinase